jgi:hypothetical protein
VWLPRHRKGRQVVTRGDDACSPPPDELRLAHIAGVGRGPGAEGARTPIDERRPLVTAHLGDGAVTGVTNRHDSSQRAFCGLFCVRTVRSGCNATCNVTCRYKLLNHRPRMAECGSRTQPPVSHYNSLADTRPSDVTTGSVPKPIRACRRPGANGCSSRGKSHRGSGAAPAARTENGMTRSTAGENVAVAAGGALGGTSLRMSGSPAAYCLPIPPPRF